MIALVALPLALQAVAMFFDELHYHRRRELSRWERVGHPLDTATVLACFALASLAPPETRWLVVYVVLAAFSSLFVTKDEWVHARDCGPGEHWLHAVLFVLHPLALGAVAFLWMQGFHSLVVAQAALTFGFGVYQLVYWNVRWRPSWMRRPTRLG